MTHQRLAHANPGILSNRLAQLEPVGPEENDRRSLSKVPISSPFSKEARHGTRCRPLCFKVSGILTKFR